MATTRKNPAPRKAAGTPAPKTPVRKAASPAAGGKNAAGKKAAAKPVPAPKAEKPKKPKLVRDSFTIPKAEYLVLDALKQRAAGLAHPIKKSELLRAGIKVLATLSDAAFLKALDQVPTIKTGRPAA
ncbi:MAG: hypothetical protein Q7T70_07595 [Polaromonas sp.]|nr:hypothetical protein [Polaromonas sp.]